MGRTPCCSGEHAGLKKGPWTHEEDEKLKSFLLHQPNTSWRLVPKKAGLIRCGKSCRLRWMNYLRPDIRRGNFTEEEENLIIQLHSAVGNKWSIIAGHLPGRTDNEIKNLWNTKLRKLLVMKGINPITHQPLCNPLLSDYVKHWVKSIENMLIMGLAASSLPDTNTTSNNNNNNSSSSNNSCVDVGVANLNMSAPSWLPQLPLQTLASGHDNLNLHNTEPSAMKMNCTALDDSSPHSNGNLCDNPVFGGDSFFAGNFSFMREEFDESTDLACLGSMHSSSLPAGFEEALKFWD